MLQNESVKRWLGGLEPAWTLLDYASFTALRAPPSPAMGPIRLAANLTHDELQQSAVARNALILLLAASSGAGLKLKETGNLSRTVVAELRDRFTWPEFDRRAAFEFNKVINEADFLPLNFVRHLAQAATLLRRHKGHLKISPAGRRLIEAPNIGALQAVLFHVAFWHFDLGILRRGLHHGWLHGHVGIILWCLSLCRRMTGSRPRACHACAQSRSTRYWTRNGTPVAMRWRRKFSDPSSGLVSSNIEKRRLIVVALSGSTSIERPACSTASFRSTFDSRVQTPYDTEIVRGPVSTEVTEERVFYRTSRPLADGIAA
jgi:hypothetical protein